MCAGCGVRYVTVEKIDDVYFTVGRGRPKGAASAVKPKAPASPPKPARGKKLLEKRTAARRQLEDMADEDYGLADDIYNEIDLPRGDLWK